MLARAPRFWARPGSLAGAVLSPIGALIGAATVRRMGQRGESVGLPVICIGNPTVGGTGKTPTAIALLNALTARGARPFALLRGHGGREPGPLRVDLDRHGPADVGDEALLLARHAPTIVSRDRPSGARLALAEGATHLVMDDGFQNPSLVKDASLLLVDAAAGIGNGHVLPAGPLRAPLRPQLARADAVLVVGEGTAGLQAARDAGAPTIEAGHLVPVAGDAQALKGKPVLAFAGIGRPEKFFATLEAVGAQIVARQAFPDHHPYGADEITALVVKARAAGLTPVTTEKDAVRLSGPAFAQVRPEIATLGVEMVPAAAHLFDDLVALAEGRFAARTRG
ncbi:tetraacyldisaccharide 4'-kinase [Aquabacter sp. L1I39]|uniref:tetraacyldisaccharide 4'-kinase n=1 Tax=Aquabacter sp. L1I39 TaxID=2820278 RepID=UPI001AD9E5B1|nr:tetraacyldisaccharide 4'-kinase [Aquabacter sp. L1I39]QTL05369.1 tetraacyldisaccharide 4'-kinase [Aquabacter sp. L1I39]